MKNIRKMLAVMISLLGTFMTVYVTLYLLVFCPARDLYVNFTSDTLTAHVLFVDLIKIFVASTVGGAVWVVFDIVAGFFRDDERDED